MLLVSMWSRHTHGQDFIGYLDNIDRRITTLFNDTSNNREMTSGSTHLYTGPSLEQATSP